ncbi:hypothetical protein ACLB2K_071706 [Fragaria x ananassa]
MSTPGSSLGRPGSWARPGSPRGSDFGLQFPPTIFVSGSPRGSDCLLNFILDQRTVAFEFPGTSSAADAWPRRAATRQNCVAHAQGGLPFTRAPNAPASRVPQLPWCASRGPSSALHHAGTTDWAELEREGPGLRFLLPGSWV